MRAASVLETPMSLSADVLLYFMKFLNPNDRFSFALSGALGWFPAVIDRDYHRIPLKAIEFGPHSTTLRQIEIRSISIEPDIDKEFYDSGAEGIFEEFMNEEIARNIRHLDVSRNRWLDKDTLMDVICSMKHLESLFISHTPIGLKSLVTIFQYCPEIRRLSFGLGGDCDRCGNSFHSAEKCEGWTEPLRRGFQNINYLEVISTNCNRKWKIIMQVLTWCVECTELKLMDTDCCNMWERIIDGCDKMENPLMKEKYDFGKKLKNLIVTSVPSSDWVKWFLPVCSNLRKLHLIDIGPHPYPDSDVIREITRLTQLNELAMTVKDESALNLITNRDQITTFRVKVERTT